MAGVTSDVGVLIVGIGGAVAVFVVLAVVTMRQIPRAQERLGVAFPAETEGSDEALDGRLAAET